jgi:DNA ligase (NAD+)
MNVEGWASLVNQLVIAASRDSSPDPTLNALTLAALERMGKKSAANLVGELERSRAVEFWRVVYAIGIRHVGERGAQALASTFGSMTALIKASVEALETVPDVGPVVARSVRAFFDEPRNCALVERLGAAGVTMAGALAPAVTLGPLTGRPSS